MNYQKKACNLLGNNKWINNQINGSILTQIDGSKATPALVSQFEFKLKYGE